MSDFYMGLIVGLALGFSTGLLYLAGDDYESNMINTKKECELTLPRPYECKTQVEWVYPAEFGGVDNDH